MNTWWAKEKSQILKELSSSEIGLSSEQVEGGIQKYGLNKLKEQKVDSFLVIFLRQFKSPLIYILIIATVIVFFLGEYIDAGVIAFVLIVNAIVGVIQEGRAQQTLQALRQFAKTKAHVIRDGKEIIIDDENLVPGDVLILRAGDKVSADARLLSSQSLKINESALTGESESVSKDADLLLKEDAQVADRKNMVFRGTFVVSGTAKAIIAETGLNTVIGNISHGISKIDSNVPLKKNIAALSNLITVAVILFSAIIFAIGIYTGHTITEMFMTAVAIAVSAIPEGLPIVITLVLATGVFRMSKQNALVKKLQAVEALGQAKIIAVDKTGTITRNELMIEEVYTNESKYFVSGEGFKPGGDIVLNENKINPLEDPKLAFTGKIATLSAASRVWFDEKKDKWMISGDPTEAAILVFGKKVGFDKGDLQEKYPMLLDIPVNSKNKYHGTVHKVENKNFITIVGAPETVLKTCKFIYKDGNKVNILDDDIKLIEDQISQMSSRGLRVLVAAVNDDMGDDIQAEKLPEMTFVCVFGMKDAIRMGVKESIKRARENGIRSVMITGDYEKTAKAIAEEAGIYKESDNILTGADLHELDEKELLRRLDKTTVFARVNPEDKLNIVEAYKKRGDIIAMTGDGVNDALSLVAADLGVAMGKSGTEVTKEAADIVLLDDNFKSIVSAVEEGRSIYNTIKKVLLYLFSTGLGELLVIALALSLTMPLPLLPSQIIWINLVTDGFLVVAMAMEPKERLTGRIVRVKHSKYIVDLSMLYRIFLMSSVMTLGTLILFSYGYEISPVKGWTMSMTVLAVFQWLNVWNCRTSRKSIFSTNPLSNTYIIWATVIVVLLHFAVLYVPFMQSIFRTTSLTLAEWGIIIAVGLSLIVVEELRKLIYRLSDNLKKEKDLEDIETALAT